MDWLDLLAVQGTLKSLLQHHSSKASILQCSAFLIVQLSYLYMTTGKTIALTRRTFVDKVMSLLLNMLSAAAKSLQSCPTLCDPIDGSPPGSSAHGIFQARVLEWIAIGFSIVIFSSSDQIRSVAQSCPTLCDPMNRSTPGLPVHHQLLEFTQTHVHRVSDAIQPSHPLSSPSPPAPNPSRHQSLFQ